MLAQLWGKRKLVQPYKALRLGEELDDKGIIGASYYGILLYGEKAWSNTNLTDSHRRNLQAGRLRCGDEWQTIFESIAGSGDHPLIRHKDWELQSNDFGIRRLATLWREMEKSRSPWFDLVGRIKIIMAVLPKYHHDPGFIATFDNIKNNIHIYFEFESNEGMR